MSPGALSSASGSTKFTAAGGLWPYCCCWPRASPSAPSAARSRCSRRRKTGNFIPNRASSANMPCAQPSRRGTGPLAEQLRAGRYKVYQRDDLIYATKGTIGRVGPIVVHVSLLLIMAGAMIGAFGGYQTQRMTSQATVSISRQSSSRVCRSRARPTGQYASTNSGSTTARTARWTSSTRISRW